MTGWLLDTNVISELRRPKPAAAVVAFVAAQSVDTLYVSTVTLAELRFGIERLDDDAKRAGLAAWLDAKVRPMFEHRTLAVTENVMLRWRIMVEIGRRANHTFAHPDLIIAAIAIEHGLTVVSRDTTDFLRAGVAVVDPWRAGAEEAR